MKIFIIVAYARNNRGIGFKGNIPWKLNKDMAHFKELTTGNAVIFGRKTFESIGRCLPNRLNIVVSRNPYYAADGVVTVCSLGEGLKAAENAGYKNAFICGGQQLYTEGLSVAEEIFATEISGDYMCDAFFPELPLNQFVEKNRTHIKENGISFDFLTMARKL